MRQRRVGTMTLGVTLILIGIIVPIGFFTDYSIINLLKYSPIVLIALGGEVLYYAIRYKDEKLKYDGLSIFMVIAITAITLTTASISPIIHNTIDYYREENKQREVVYENLEDAAVTLADYDSEFHIYDNQNSYDRFVFRSSLINEKEHNYDFHCNVNFYQNQKSLTKEDAVKVITDFVNELNGKLDSIDSMNIRVEHKTGSYYIELSGKRLEQLSADWVAKAIDIQNNETEQTNNNLESINEEETVVIE